MDASAGAAVTKEPPTPATETIKSSSVLQVENLLKELKLGEVYDDKVFAAANHTQVCSPHAQRAYTAFNVEFFCSQLVRTFLSMKKVDVGDIASIKALENFLGDKMEDSMDMYFLCVKKKNEYRASIPRPTPQEVVDNLFPGQFVLNSKPVTEYDKEDTEVMTCLYRPANAKKASVVIKIMSIALETRKHAISHAQREIHMLKCFRARKQTQHICKLLDNAEKLFKRDIRSWQQFGIVMEDMVCIII